ncbi:MAG: recombinase family protein [Rhodospirillales bacterium]
MKKLGYIRVSTQEQCPDRQIDGLAELCDRLFIERLSAVSKKRPVLEGVLEELQPGDALLIWDLDRAFRSVVDAIQQVEALKARDISLQIVNLQVDTTTPGGMLVYTVLSACAEFERRMLSQRTKEGLAAARKRGARLGRPPKMTAADLASARKRLATGKHRVKDIARDYGVAPWSLTRALKRDSQPESRF